MAADLKTWVSCGKFRVSIAGFEILKFDEEEEKAWNRGDGGQNKFYHSDPSSSII